MSNENYDLVPPDGGWGWLVLIGSTLVNILIPGVIKSFGVIFVEFLEAFDASPATASWIPALCYFLYSSLGPLSSVLSIKYSYRTVTIIGGLSAVIGMVLSFWVTSVTQLYFSFGVLVGSGAGLSFPPTVYIVTSYFVKLRGLANGICISGSAFGSVILPPLLYWMLEIYGYRGACLLMGAFNLNVFVAALLYQPVEEHLKRVPKIKDKLTNTEESEDTGIIVKLKESNGSQKANTILNSEPISTMEMHYSRIMPTNNADEGLVYYDKSENCVPKRNQTYAGNQSLVSAVMMFGSHDANISNNKLRRHSVMLHTNTKLQNQATSLSSFDYISTPFHGSTLSFQPNHFSSHISLKSVTSSKAEKEAKPTLINQKENLFDLSLFLDPVYLVILISNSTSAISYTNLIIYLPAFAISLGFDKSLAAYLLSIVSATDLVGRIGGAALSDLNIMPKSWYFVGGLALSGISLMCLPLTSDYIAISFWCAFFGLASGIYMGTTAVVMADLLGIERLTSSYGISLFINGLLQLIGPPLCSVWYEAVGTYVPLFIFLGVLLIAGAALWVFLPIIERKRSIRKFGNQ